MFGPTPSESYGRLKQTLATVPLYTGNGIVQTGNGIMQQEMELCKHNLVVELRIPEGTATHTCVCVH